MVFAMEVGSGEFSRRRGVCQFNFGKRVGTYRALFTIADEEVRILHIRRAAMGIAPASEVED